jgi:hypothetical protein
VDRAPHQGARPLEAHYPHHIVDLAALVLAIKRQKYDHNPVSVVPQRKEPPGRDRFLPPADFRKLLDECRAEPELYAFLLITPEQAEVLSLASNETRIQLVLRNPLDTESSKTPGIAMSTLFGDAAKPPAAAAPRARVVAALVKKPAPESPRVVVVPVYQIEIFNGPLRSEAKFAHPPEEKK